jgi:hypothetical protein
VTEAFEIHPSTLSQAVDCELRAVVSREPGMFRALGYEVAQLRPTAGAVVGQGVHSGIAYMSKQQMIESAYTLEDGVEFGIVKFRKEIDNGWSTDDITASANDAEKQIERMTRSYWATDGYTATPLLVEQRYEAGLSNLLGHSGYVLTGTLDRLDRKGDSQRLIDLKTGKKNSIHPLQLAAYLLLAQTHGWAAQWLGHVFMKRVQPDKPTERPVPLEYPATMATRALVPAVRRLVRSIEAFKKTQNPNEFAMNPSSMYCSARYCSAYGSAVCSMWPLKEAIK